KEGAGKVTIELEPTEDIIAGVAASANCHGRIVVGFAAESQSLVEYAQKKLREKRLDFVVANDISRTDAGFDTDANAVTVVRRDGQIVTHPLRPKRELADQLLDDFIGMR